MGWDDNVLCLLQACSMLRHCDVGCTCTHHRCYAILGVGWDVLTFVALEHMVDATQQKGRQTVNAEKTKETNAAVARLEI